MSWKFTLKSLSGIDRLKETRTSYHDSLMTCQEEVIKGNSRLQLVIFILLALWSLGCDRKQQYFNLQSGTSGRRLSILCTVSQSIALIARLQFLLELAPSFGRRERVNVLPWWHKCWGWKCIVQKPIAEVDTWLSNQSCFVSHMQHSLTILSPLLTWRELWLTVLLVLISMTMALCLYLSSACRTAVTLRRWST